MGTDEQDPTSAIAATSAALDHLEQGLLTLIRAGAHAATPLDEVTEGLAALLPDTRRQDRRVAGGPGRGGGGVAHPTPGGEHVRRRVLWLYRKTRLEHLFFAKLAFERTIRDLLYKQILEMYEELSSLEEAEGKVRHLGDDELAAALLEAG